LNLTETINKNRKEEDHINEGDFLNTSEYMNNLVSTISTSPNIDANSKTSSYTTLGGLWWAEFKKRIEPMDKDQIETELNTNKATQAYAKTLLWTELATSKWKFTISENTDTRTNTDKPYLAIKE
jgi:hypothetical protein